MKTFLPNICLLLCVITNVWGMITRLKVKMFEIGFDDFGQENVVKAEFTCVKQLNLLQAIYEWKNVYRNLMK